MSFDLQAFLSAPSQELLNLAKKSDLLDIAAHYELTNSYASFLCYGYHVVRIALLSIYVCLSVMKIQSRMILLSCGQHFPHYMSNGD